MATGDGALPNLIIIGAQKCGTSALHYYLDLHPEIAMSAPKELNFFCERPDLGADPARHEPLERMLSRTGGSANWSRGLDWYRRHFRSEAAVRGEASPNYTAPWYSDRAAELMAATIPGAKLVFMVRDPLDQIVSAWMHYRAAGNEPRPLEEAVSDPNGMYMERARYRARLDPYLQRFGPEAILICTQEELRAERRQTVARVFRFAGVDDGFWTPRMERERHRTETRNRRTRALRRLQFRSPARHLVRVLPQELKWRIERLATAGGGHEQRPAFSDRTRGRIAGWLAEDVAALRALTGRSFEEWSL